MTQANNVAIESSQINSSGVLQVAGGGTGVTTSTGTGALVLNSSPTFIGTTVIPTINSGTSTALTLQSNGTTAITVDTSQNVGIGTSSPNAKFVISNAGVQNIEFGYSAGLAANFMQSINRSTGGDVDMAYFLINTGVHKFYTASTERMRIDSSGNVLIGTTSASTYAAGGKFYSLPTGTTNATGITTGCWSTTGNAINFFSGVGTGAAYAGAISLNGSVTLYTSASDRRLKSNITPITGVESGPIIDALKPCSFTMNSNGSIEKGFIADEFQTVISGAVFGEPNQVDKEGNAVYQAIDSASPEVIAYLVAEIQSLRKRVAQLESK
jgi:hypothetical protein